MTVLALDTSTLAQSLALGSGKYTLATLHLGHTRGHARLLATSLQQSLERCGLELKDLSSIIVGLGPGSFTGLRIGISFGAGLARALNIPLAGAPSWLACATMLPPNGRMLYACDARKGEVYAAVASTGPGSRTLMKAGAYSPQRLHAELENHFGPTPRLWRCGNAFRLLPDAMQCLAGFTASDTDTLEDPPAEGLLRLMREQHPDIVRALPLEPLYLRPSDAERSHS